MEMISVDWYCDDESVVIARNARRVDAHFPAGAVTKGHVPAHVVATLDVHCS